MAAVLAESRVSPLDGGNMNRAFPGGADAGPTRGVAGFVTAHLLPGAAVGCRASTCLAGGQRLGRWSRKTPAMAPPCCCPTRPAPDALHTDRTPTAHILGTDAMKPPQCPIALFTPPKAGLGFS